MTLRRQEASPRTRWHCANCGWFYGEHQVNDACPECGRHLTERVVDLSKEMDPVFLQEINSGRERVD